MSQSKLIIWWERSIFAALCCSIALLGLGPLESSASAASASAWSVSRTAFFFWLVSKLFVGLRSGRAQLDVGKLAAPLPVLIFFGVVTISLLPDFHDPGDYRYFFFAAMHYLMVLDLFASPRRLRLAYLLVALLPGVLLLRGILHDPALLGLADMRRFAHPLPHPNIAGYLFAMTIPLCLAAAVAEKGKLRWLAAVSCAAQVGALLLTYSRGAWLGWTASMLFFGATLKRKEVGVLLLLGGLLLSFATPLRERVITLARPQTDVSINERMAAMTAGLKLGLEHPLLGVGYGRGRLREGLRELYGGSANDIHRIAHTHNLYIELFAQTGALGLGAFLWLLGQGLWRILSGARRAEGANRILQFGMAASWIAFIVTGIGDVPLFHHEVRILFFTLLALIHLHWRNGASARSRGENLV